MNQLVLTTGRPHRIGFVSTRFYGTDGVTLEARKWANILSGMGHSCFWMAGLFNPAPEVSYSCPLAYFNHPDVAALQNRLFGAPHHPPGTRNQGAP